MLHRNIYVPTSFLKQLYSNETWHEWLSRSWREWPNLKSQQNQILYYKKKGSKLFLSIIFKYHNGIWSIFLSATWLAILGKSVWFSSKDDIEYSQSGSHYSACISLELRDCYSDHPRKGPAKECVIWHLSLPPFALWAARPVSWKCLGAIGKMTKKDTFLLCPARFMAPDPALLLAIGWWVWDG